MMAAVDNKKAYKDWLTAHQIKKSSENLAEEVGEPKEPAPYKPTSRAVANAQKSMLQMLQTKDWTDAKPKHLVALWAWCHTGLYGVEPVEELAPTAFHKACLKAGQVLKKSFDGDIKKMIEFMRWSWNREKARYKYNPDRQRLSIGLQFSAACVGDWRVATAGRIANSV